MADWIRGLIDAWGYAGVAFLMLLETVFPPLPSEIIMPLAGRTAARGGLALEGVIAAGTAGAMLGNYAWFLLARQVGEDRLRRFVRRHGRWLTLRPHDIDKADRWFDRWGAWCVGVGRVLPTARSLVSVPAGLFGMGHGRFLLASTAGTALWTGGLGYAGYALGRSAPRIADWMEPVSSVVLGVLVLLYVVRLFRHQNGG